MEPTQDDGGGRGYICRIRGPLSDNQGDLVRQAPAKTRNNLISHPLANTRIQIKCIQESGTNDSNGCANYFQRDSPTKLGNQGTRGSHRHSNRHDQRKVVDPRHCRTDVVYTLEVNGQLIDDEEVGSGEEHRKEGAEADCALLDDTRYDHRSLALVHLPENEGDHDESSSDEEADDFAVAPCILLAAVLEGEDIGNERADHHDNSNGVHLEELFPPCCFDGLGAGWCVEEEEDNDCRDGTNREVDVEAPAPSRMVRKDTANQRPNNGSKAIRHSDEASVQSSLRRLHDKRNDGVRAGTNPRSSNTSDGPSDDQRRRVGSSAADDAAEFKDENRGEERPLEGEVLVGLAPG